MTEPLLVHIADEAKNAMQASIGVRTDFQSTKVDVIQDDYGQESFEVRMYYRGPWEYGGSYRSMRMHVNREEALLFPIAMKAIRHGYSDEIVLPRSSINVYSLEEVVSEKLRAIAGQRRFAIARDLFDIHYLSTQSLNIEEVCKAFPKKCEMKGIRIKEIDLGKLKERRSEYEANWKDNLE
jgi:predicted nucleotidyltransferase component of viral defense system